MEQIFDTFRQHFKEVLPLGNLHILENDNASAIHITSKLAKSL